MKKALSRLTPSLMILSILTFSSYSVSAFETEALVIPRVVILIPGISSTIEITQNYKFPQDFSQFLILAIGDGPLGITLTKSGSKEDTLFLTGVGISSAGIIPVFKFGSGDTVTLRESVEIGDERSPYGLLWISSWVDSTVNDPPYSYSLTLTF
jgi:hypothetical protein